MKKLFKWVLITVLVFVILIVLGLSYISMFKPDVGKAPDLKVEVTPERVKRGEYIANCVAVCMDCHSTRNWNAFSAPMTPGTTGCGGERFDKTMGFPGVYYSRNLTPYGLKDWTDGEIFRAITTGVKKNGEPIFPVMPYHYYGRVDKEDIYSVIAYLRTLPEIKKDIPESKSDFPFNFILRTIPHPAEFGKKPSESDTLAYGKYLVQMAGCVECHTRFENNQLVAGTEFGGGRMFDLPGGRLVTPNITPDNATGIGLWTREAFVAKFKMFADSNYHAPALDMRTDFNTIMPWTMYGKMTESDLSSIYKFLRSLEPKTHKIEKWIPKGQVASAS